MNDSTAFLGGNENCLHCLSSLLDRLLNRPIDRHADERRSGNTHLAGFFIRFCKEIKYFSYFEKGFLSSL